MSNNLNINLEINQQDVTDSELSPQMAILKTWQTERLTRTHADLLNSDRYRLACEFFLDEIYAPQDFSQRDEDGERMYNFLRKFIPGRIIRSMALAVQLNKLTNHLDTALLEVLVNDLGMTDTLTAEMYAEAYRICDNYEERRKQIEMVMEIGRGVGRLARLPLISLSLKVMKGTITTQGSFELHKFLDRGLTAFKQMKGTKKFLALVEQRELQILDNIFAGEAEPFDV